VALNPADRNAKKTYITSDAGFNRQFKIWKTIEVVSKPRITPAGKAQADSKAQPPRQVVSIARGLQRRQRVSDDV
jgi:hypothetical protein